MPSGVPRQSEAAFLAMADFLLAAWLAWMTPLLTALSSLVEAACRAACAASLSPASAASRNLRTQVLTSLLTALLRSVATRFVLIRLSWDLMFATGVVFLVGRWLPLEGGRSRSGPGVGHLWLSGSGWCFVRARPCAHAIGKSTSAGARPPKRVE